MDIIVTVGSKVTLEVYLGEVKIDGNNRRKHLSYNQVFRVTTFTIKEDCSRDDFGKCVHPDSFAGRALIGRKVGDEVEVNVGGLSVEEARVNQATGNHLKYKIVEIS